MSDGKIVHRKVFITGVFVCIQCVCMCVCVRTSVRVCPCVSVHMCAHTVCVHMCAWRPIPMWRSESDFWSQFSPSPSGSWDQTQVIRLVEKRFYSPRHLTSPNLPMADDERRLPHRRPFWVQAFQDSVPCISWHSVLHSRAVNRRPRTVCFLPQSLFPGGMEM